MYLLLNSIDYIVKYLTFAKNQIYAANDNIIKTASCNLDEKFCNNKQQA